MKTTEKKKAPAKKKKGACLNLQRKDKNQQETLPRSLGRLAPDPFIWKKKARAEEGGNPGRGKEFLATFHKGGGCPWRK